MTVFDPRRGALPKQSEWATDRVPAWRAMLPPPLREHHSRRTRPLLSHLPPRQNSWVEFGR